MCILDLFLLIVYIRTLPHLSQKKIPSPGCHRSPAPRPEKPILIMYKRVKRRKEGSDQHCIRCNIYLQYLLVQHRVAKLNISTNNGGESWGSIFDF